MYRNKALGVVLGFIYAFVFIATFTADIISCVEFNEDGDLLATGDKGGRVVIFQRDPGVRMASRPL